jgi:hypothetical protein
MYQLWERAFHHQKRADVSKNFGPMCSQAVELSTKDHVFVKTDTLKFVTYVCCAHKNTEPVPPSSLCFHANCFRICL